MDAEQIRVKVMDSHVGRSFSGHPLEDECPCPKEPCGLVAMTRASADCTEHALTAGKTIRQSHPSERCPG